jgi:hypothetical protein
MSTPPLPKPIPTPRPDGLLTRLTRPIQHGPPCPFSNTVATPAMLFPLAFDVPCTPFHPTGTSDSRLIPRCATMTQP